MKLDRLHLIVGDYLEAVTLHSALIEGIFNRYNLLLRFGLRYPVSYDDVINMINLENWREKYLVGINSMNFIEGTDIWYNYIKILDVEYGNFGRELRVIRPVVESLYVRYTL